MTLGDQHYLTGTNQRLYGVHPEEEHCRTFGCAIHNPSDHPLRDWPTHWDGHRRVLRRICPHGELAPDPDETQFRALRGLNLDLDTVQSCEVCRVTIDLTLTLSTRTRVEA